MKEITWNNFYQSTLNLSKKIQEQDIQYQVIVAIAKGGLIPARILANTLNIDKVISIGVKSYTYDQQSSCEVYQDINGSYNTLYGNNILIIDDLSDTGTTFKLTVSKVNQHQPKQVSTAANYVKKDTLFWPTYYDKVVETKIWITFPWEVEQICSKNS